jgi:predicted DsbA family dithiol-disulfide isomerase
MNAPGRDALTLDVVSDVVCPWCFIGKRRLEKALGLADVPLTIRWRPFQLDPTIPPEGKSREEYLRRKFGSDERIRRLHDNVANVGAKDGIDFAFDRIAVSPNTLDAHRLIRWAGAAGVQEEIVEALFRAYFLEGRNIGDHTVLVSIAAAAGMDREMVAARLASEEDRAVVRQEIEAAQQMGVSGVPTFIIASRYALVGAQPAEELAAALRNVAARVSSEEANAASAL